MLSNLSIAGQNASVSFEALNPIANFLVLAKEHLYCIVNEFHFIKICDKQSRMKKTHVQGTALQFLNSCFPDSISKLIYFQDIVSLFKQ